MGESRTELIAWLNELLQVNYTKVEQCGTGAVYAQIMDSIYGDLPMSRVKFNAKQEYEYLANFKILQNHFKAKKIDKPIPVERLVKCKMQDNLEFLQWIKRFWEANYGGQPYDPVARRRGAPIETPATVAPIGGGAGGGLRSSAGSGAAGARGRTPVGGARLASGAAGGGVSAQAAEQIRTLEAENREFRTSLEGLEKERDFYFAKLRDIEILVQQQMEKLEEAGTEDETLKQIQQILYSTEDGFEVPETNPVVDEEETF